MKCFVLAVIFISLAWDGAKLVRSEKEWREALGPERYRIMRLKGTERAFIGAYARPSRAPGLYLCAGCELTLFDAQDQYDAGGGYPCFTKLASPKNAYYEEDFSLPFKRYEVLCRKCDSHLGHLFHDGPPPKHLRYCINSLSLTLESDHAAKKRN